MKNMRDVLNDLVKEDLTPGELVRSVRNNFGISQEKVCEVTGIQRPNLSAIENGHIEMTVHYATLLGAALGLHPSTILFPNGYFEKTKEIVEIEKKAATVFNKIKVG